MGNRPLQNRSKAPHLHIPTHWSAALTFHQTQAAQSATGANRKNESHRPILRPNMYHHPTQPHRQGPKAIFTRSVKTRSPKSNETCPRRPLMSENKLPNMDPMDLIRQFVNEFPTQPTPLPQECECELQYAHSVFEKTPDLPSRTQDPLANPMASHTPVLLASSTTEHMDQQLQVLEPGLLKISQPLVLMSEIQL